MRIHPAVLIFAGNLDGNYNAYSSSVFEQDTGSGWAEDRVVIGFDAAS